MTTWFLRHLQVLFDTLGRMFRAPLTTLLTLLVIGVAISMPVTLFRISQSMMMISGSWESSREITVFVKVPKEMLENYSVNDIDAHAIEFGRQLLEIPRIRDIEYISPQKGLAELSGATGLEDAFDEALQSPIPPMLLVYPESGVSNLDVNILADQLESMEQVDSLVFDYQWAERLAGIVDIAVKAVVILGVLMALGVVLVIGNSVRAGIQQRSEEIEIIDQIGGTSAFLRRPFLYLGVVQGVVGGTIAVFISITAIAVLNGSVQELAALYGTVFSIPTIDPKFTLMIIGCTGFLGWGTARMTVSAYLSRLRPKV